MKTLALILILTYIQTSPPLSKARDREGFAILSEANQQKAPPFKEGMGVVSLHQINPHWKTQYPALANTQIQTSPHLSKGRDREGFVIQTHLQLTEKLLRQKPTNHLNPQQKANRIKHLDRLKTYHQAQTFPINTYKPYRTPVFRDNNLTLCAVGYLLFQDNQTALVQTVVQTNNFITINQITHPAFHRWQTQSGLTLTELALIQPGYEPRMPVLPDTNFYKIGHIKCKGFEFGHTKKKEKLCLYNAENQIVFDSTFNLWYYTPMDSNHKYNYNDSVENTMSSIHYYSYNHKGLLSKEIYKGNYEYEKNFLYDIGLSLNGN